MSTPDGPPRDPVETVTSPPDRAIQFAQGSLPSYANRPSWMNDYVNIDIYNQLPDSIKIEPEIQGLLEQYTLKRAIGTGKSAVVFEVEGQSGNKLAAKINTREAMGNKVFRGEAQTVATVRSATDSAKTDSARPVRVYESFDHDGVTVLVSELLNPEWRLEEIGKSDDKPPMSLALKYATQILTFIHQLHAVNITYDDFKRENLWLHPTEQRIVVTDLNVVGHGVDQSKRARDTIRACSYILSLFPNFKNPNYFEQGDDLVCQPHFEELPLEFQSILTAGFQHPDVTPLSTLCEKLEKLSQLAATVWDQERSTAVRNMARLESAMDGASLSPEAMHINTERILTTLDLARTKMEESEASGKADSNDDYIRELRAIERRALHRSPVFAVRYLASTSDQRVTTAQGGLDSWSADSDKVSEAQRIAQWFDQVSGLFPQEAEAVVADLQQQNFADGDVVYAVLSQDLIKSHGAIAWFVCRYLTDPSPAPVQELATSTTHVHQVITELHSLDTQAYAKRLQLFKQLQDATATFSRHDQDLLWVFGQIRVADIPHIVAGLEVLQTQPIGAVEAQLRLSQLQREMTVINAINNEAPTWQLHSVAREMDRLDRRLTLHAFGDRQRTEVLRLLAIEDGSSFLTDFDREFDIVFQRMISISLSGVVATLHTYVDSGRCGAPDLARILWKNSLLSRKGGARDLSIDQVLFLAKTIEARQLESASNQKPDMFSRLSRAEQSSLDEIRNNISLNTQSGQAIVDRRNQVADDIDAIDAQIKELARSLPVDHDPDELRTSMREIAIMQRLADPGASADHGIEQDQQTVTILNQLAKSKLDTIDNLADAIHSQEERIAKSQRLIEIMAELQSSLDQESVQIVNAEELIAELTAAAQFPDTSNTDLSGYVQDYIGLYKRYCVKLVGKMSSNQPSEKEGLNVTFKNVMDFANLEKKEAQESRAALTTQRDAAQWLQDEISTIASSQRGSHSFTNVPRIIQAMATDKLHTLCRGKAVDEMLEELRTSLDTTEQIVDQITDLERQLVNKRSQAVDLDQQQAVTSENRTLLVSQEQALLDSARQSRVAEFAEQHGFWAESLEGLIACWQEYESERTKQPPSFQRTQELAVESKQLLRGLNSYARALVETSFPGFGDYLEDVELFDVSKIAAHETSTVSGDGANKDSIATELGRMQNYHDGQIEMWRNGDEQLGIEANVEKATLYRVYQLSNQYFFKGSDAVLPRYLSGRGQSVATWLHTPQRGSEQPITHRILAVVEEVAFYESRYLQLKSDDKSADNTLSLVSQARRKLDNLVSQATMPILDYAAQYPSAVRKPARPQWDILRKGLMPAPAHLHGRFEDWLREQVVIECVLTALRDIPDASDTAILELFAEYDSQLTSDMLQALAGRSGEVAGAVTRDALRNIEQQARNIPQAVRKLARALVASESPPESPINPEPSLFQPDLWSPLPPDHDQSVKAAKLRQQEAWYARLVGRIDQQARAFLDSESGRQLAEQLPLLRRAQDARSAHALAETVVVPQLTQQLLARIQATPSYLYDRLTQAPAVTEALTTYTAAERAYQELQATQSVDQDTYQTAVTNLCGSFFTLVLATLAHPDQVDLDALPAQLSELLSKITPIFERYRSSFSSLPEANRQKLATILTTLIGTFYAVAVPTSPTITQLFAHIAHSPN